MAGKAIVDTSIARAQRRAVQKNLLINFAFKLPVT
jgi:hypothetical protein